MEVIEPGIGDVVPTQGKHLQSSQPLERGQRPIGDPGVHENQRLEFRQTLQVLDGRVSHGSVANVKFLDFGKGLEVRQDDIRHAGTRRTLRSRSTCPLRMDRSWQRLPLFRSRRSLVPAQYATPGGIAPADPARQQEWNQNGQGSGRIRAIGSFARRRGLGTFWASARPWSKHPDCS